MIQWDARGVKGILDHYEVSLHEREDGWQAIVWVRKTHIGTLSKLKSLEIAQKKSSAWLEKMADDTKKMMKRIGYFDVPAELEDAG